ncbi:MAG TPA: MFS transporter [Kofleriaceae bacterium]|nr:MFS transporter [Kofleriaceae bacterium]
MNRIGLGRPELRAWAMYDWANSAFVTTVISGLFPPYFAAVACKGVDADTATSRLATGTTIALAIIAVLSPILGAIADRAPIKKRMLGAFTTMGVIVSALLATVGEGDWIWGLVLFGAGNIAANGAFVFYDSLLPHVAREDELDRVSTAGYALGYVGGGILLAINAVMVLKPALFGLADAGAAVRWSCVTVAIWWAVFATPLFRRVPEPHHRGEGRERGLAIVPAAFRDLAATFRELRRYRQALLLLLAFLIYNDGIGTIIRMSTVYGASIGLKPGAMITALIVVQFVGIPASFAFGALAGKIGTRKAIFVGLAVYCGVSVYGYFMKTSTDFFILAGMVGLVQGGTQALSRSLFASMIPKAKSSELFGLFAVFEKFAGIFGPAVFALAINAFGSSRPAILSVVGFFVTGAILLALVDVKAGQAVAAAANAND